MKKMYEATLIQVEVFNDGDSWSLQWKGRSFVHRGDVDSFAKLLQKIKASDDHEEPRSYRSERYIDIANEIANGTDRIIWVWEHMLKKLYEEITMENVVIIKEEMRLPGTDIILESGDRISVVEAYGSRSSGTPILPIGAVNMITGENRILDNIYQNWDNMNLTAEFWEVRQGKLVLIFTFGSKPLYKIGDSNIFIHDQSRRPLFDGANIDMINYCKIEDLTIKGPQIVGKNSIKAYVYK